MNLLSADDLEACMDHHLQAAFVAAANGLEMCRHCPIVLKDVLPMDQHFTDAHKGKLMPTAAVDHTAKEQYCPSLDDFYVDTADARHASAMEVASAEFGCQLAKVALYYEFLLYRNLQTGTTMFMAGRRPRLNPNRDGLRPLHLCVQPGCTVLVGDAKAMDTHYNQKHPDEFKPYVGVLASTVGAGLPNLMGDSCSYSATAAALQPCKDVLTARLSCATPALLEALCTPSYRNACRFKLVLHDLQAYCVTQRWSLKDTTLQFVRDLCTTDIEEDPSIRFSVDEDWQHGDPLFLDREHKKTYGPIDAWFLLYALAHALCMAPSGPRVGIAQQISEERLPDALVASMLANCGGAEVIFLRCASADEPSGLASMGPHLVQLNGTEHQYYLVSFIALVNRAPAHAATAAYVDGNWRIYDGQHSYTLPNATLVELLQKHAFIGVFMRGDKHIKSKETLNRPLGTARELVQQRAEVTLDVHAEYASRLDAMDRQMESLRALLAEKDAQLAERERAGRQLPSVEAQVELRPVRGSSLFDCTPRQSGSVQQRTEDSVQREMETSRQVRALDDMKAINAEAMQLLEASTASQRRAMEGTRDEYLRVEAQTAEMTRCRDASVEASRSIELQKSQAEEQNRALAASLQTQQEKQHLLKGQLEDTKAALGRLAAEHEALQDKVQLEKANLVRWGGLRDSAAEAVRVAERRQSQLQVQRSQLDDKFHEDNAQLSLNLSQQAAQAPQLVEISVRVAQTLQAQMRQLYDAQVAEHELSRNDMRSALQAALGQQAKATEALERQTETISSLQAQICANRNTSMEMKTTRQVMELTWLQEKVMVRGEGEAQAKRTRADDTEPRTDPRLVVPDGVSVEVATPVATLGPQSASPDRSRSTRHLSHMRQRTPSKSPSQAGAPLSIEWKDDPRASQSPEPRAAGQPEGGIATSGYTSLRFAGVPDWVKLKKRVHFTPVEDNETVTTTSEAAVALAAQSPPTLPSPTIPALPQLRGILKHASTDNGMEIPLPRSTIQASHDDAKPSRCPWATLRPVAPSTSALPITEWPTLQAVMLANAQTMVSSAPRLVKRRAEPDWTPMEEGPAPDPAPTCADCDECDPDLEMTTCCLCQRTVHKSHFPDHHCVPTHRIHRTHRVCHCCLGRGQSDDIECDLCGKEAHRRCTTLRGDSQACLSCTEGLRFAELPRQRLAHCTDCDRSMELRTANRCHWCKVPIHSRCWINDPETHILMCKRCYTYPEFAATAEAIARRSAQDKAAARHTKKEANKVAKCSRLVARARVVEKISDSCTSMHIVHQNLRGFSTRGETKLRTILQIYAESSLLIFLTETHVTRESLPLMRAVAREFGYEVLSSEPRDTNQWGSAILYPKNHLDCESLPIPMELGSLAAAKFTGVGGFVVTAAAVYLPPCDTHEKEAAIAAELAALSDINIVAGDFNANIAGKILTTCTTKTLRGKNICRILGRVINSRESTMRADMTAATNDLIILSGDFHSRSTYNGMPTESDHLPVEADVGLGTMPFTRVVTKRKLRCYEALQDPDWLVKWAIEAEKRVARLGPIMGDNVHQAHRSVIHILKSLTMSIPVRTVTDTPSFVQDHRAACDVIALRYKERIAEIEASDGPDEAKRADLASLAVSTQSQYQALADTQKVKFIGRAHAMSPSKLYGLFTKSERPSKPFVLREGVRLSDKDSAKEFQKTFAAKCTNPDVNIEDILNTAPSDWNDTTWFRSQTTRVAPSYAEVIHERHWQILTGLPKLPEEARHDDLPITAEEVHAAIMMHPVSDTPDVDGIPLCVLQALPLGVLHTYLAKLFTRCRDIGIVPRGWKLQLIVPAYKGSPKPLGEPDSYRPISITSYICRTWERVVVLRLESKLACLSPSQFGYLRARTPEQLLGIVHRRLESITETSSKDNPAHFTAAALSFDCTDAFCKVTPAMVRKALLRIGVDEATVNLIVEWLTDRRQSVKVGDAFTAYIIVEAGLPQGSVLGPILWDVVFDDLNVYLYRKAPGATKGVLPQHVLEVSFADDMEMVVGAPTSGLAARRLAEWGGHAVAWFRAAGIPISTKTKASFFHRSAKPPQPETLKMFAGKYGGLDIDIGANGLKILGVQFSSDGTCKQHLEDLVEHLEGVHQTLRAVAKLVHPEKVRQIYAQQGLSKLRYGAAASWQVETVDYKAPHGHTRDPRGWVHKAVKDKLQAVHQACARTIIGAGFSCNGDLALREARLSSIDTTMQLQVARSHCLLKGRRGMEHAMTIGRNPLPLFEGLMAGDAGAINQPSLVALPFHPGVASVASRHVTFIMGQDVKEPKQKVLSLDERVKLSLSAKEKLLEDHKAAYDRLKKAENDRRAQSLPVYDLTLATDGSLSKRLPEGRRKKGISRAGWSYFMEGDIGECKNSWQCFTAAPPSIFTLEGFAGFEGLRRLLSVLENGGEGVATPPAGRRWRVLWKTDSKSIAEALRRGPLRQKDIIAATLWDLLTKISQLGVDVDIMHVYSHVGDVENGYADMLAGSEYAQELDFTPFTPRDAAALLEAKILEKEAAAFVNLGLRRWWLTRNQRAFVEFPKGMKRGDLRALMQLRTGACKLLGGHLHGITDPCQQCGKLVMARGGAAAVHLFACESKQAVELREKHLQMSKYCTPGALWCMPREALAYAKEFWSTPAVEDSPEATHFDP